MSQIIIHVMTKQKEFDLSSKKMSVDDLTMDLRALGVGNMMTL